MDDFYNWWQNTIHGNYISNEQYDRIVANNEAEAVTAI